MGLEATEDSEQKRDLRGSGALRRPLVALGELWGGSRGNCAGPGRRWCALDLVGLWRR